MKTSVFEALAQAARKNEPVALGIISRVKGSSPQKIGSKALFYPDGRIAGTLGGGCLEAEIQQRAIQSLRHAHGTTFELVLDHDFGWDDGLICGGKVEGLILPNAQKVGEDFWAKLAARKSRIEWGVRKDYSVTTAKGVFEPDLDARATDSTTAAPGWLYRETITPPCELWIAGAGHIAQAVAPLAAQLDFRVTVIDDRPALASHSYFPAEIVLKADAWEKLLSAPGPTAPAFGLIVTRGHRHDALVLQAWLRYPFLFLGMIGSSRKARIIFDHFLADGLATPEQLARVACPVGIPIRSSTVTEIAVSIMAQFIEKRAELAYGQTLQPPASELTRS